LESFQVKKQLEATRQELSQSLYQHDAACRVIARLLSERDDARAALSSLKAQGQAMDVERGGPSSITPEIISNMVQLHQSLSTQRKDRKVSPTLASVDDLKNYAVQGSHPIHKANEAGITCLDLHPNEDRVVTGGVDKTAVVFNHVNGKKVATLAGHLKKITSVLFHPTQDVILTASADKSAKVWTQSSDGYQTTSKIRTHTAEVSGISLHPSGEYLATASLDGTWAFHDIRSGNCLEHIQDANITAGLEAVSFHPDGLLLAAGASDNVVRLWDIKDNRKLVFAFKGHKGPVSSVVFSENGYFMATASSDSTVKLWDLRKLKDLKTFQLPDGSAAKVSFDYSGVYLASAGENIRVFSAKNLETVHVYEAHTSRVTDVKFSRDAKSFFSTSMDRTLKIWSPSN